MVSTQLLPHLLIAIHPLYLFAQAGHQQAPYVSGASMLSLLLEPTGGACALALLQVYVCASFLGTWHSELLKLEFQELMMFLQRLPTGSWGDTQVESVLSGAYVLRNTWDTAQSHIHS
jgi:hypothetical protein